MINMSNAREPQSRHSTLGNKKCRLGANVTTTKGGAAAAFFCVSFEISTKYTPTPCLVVTKLDCAKAPVVRVL